jgi:hypothetical protein
MSRCTRCVDIAGGRRPAGSRSSLATRAAAGGTERLPLHRAATIVGSAERTHAGTTTVELKTNSTLTDVSSR